MVPVPVGVNGTAEGKDGVNVAETTVETPFASVVVYTNGVGPPGVTGVVPGCPTTCGVVVTAALVVGDVVEDVVAGVVAGVGVVAGEVLDVVPGPRVCLVCTRSEAYWDI